MKKHILIVEDNESLARVTEMALVLLGHHPANFDLPDGKAWDQEGIMP